MAVAPDRRAWFRRDGRNWNEVFHTEALDVAEGWGREALSKPMHTMLRVTVVGDNWYCLDAWFRPSPIDSDFDEELPPTEADIPAGFV